MILPIHPFSHEQEAAGTNSESIEVLIVDLELHTCNWSA